MVGKKPAQPEYIHNLTFKGQKITVIGIPYKKGTVPVIIDTEDMNFFREHSMNYGSRGFIISASRSPMYYLHTLIAEKHDIDECSDHTCVHLSTIKLDNRKCNIRYVPNSDAHNYQSGKTRNTKFPEESGIDPNEVPVYISYKAPEYKDKKIGKSSGIRKKETFNIELPFKPPTIDKTNAGLSTRDKLNIAKLQLRKIIDENPDFFENKAMNGDLLPESVKKYEEYFEILDSVGVESFIEKTKVTGNTNELLKVSDKEIKSIKNVLTNFNF